MKNIKSVAWLEKHLKDEDLIIVDCRFVLTDPKNGHENYHIGHIPRAIYLDLEQDMSGEKKKHGGRHPLPNINQFINRLGIAGITEKSTVIAYDNGSCEMASRLWFLLKYIGHEKVYVLDGGLNEWIAKGNSLSTEIVSTKEVQYRANIQDHLIVDMDEVKDALSDPAVQLIDARARDRYEGKVEPIDPVAGHIPTAENYFWQNNLSNGKWKTKDELISLYNNLKPYRIISYCGSGVTACVNILGMDEAGIHSKLYAGSWSDWSSYQENKVER